MTYDARDVARVRNSVLAVSAAGWLLLLAAPLHMVAHCPAVGSGAMPSLQMLLSMNPPVPLAAGFALMLVAMMSPLLIPPICYLRLRSFAERRARSVTIFAIAYAAVWIASGGVLLTLGLVAALFAPQSYRPAAIVFLVALVWQFSPVKQRCLNRCHCQGEIAAFGAAADLDAFRFGVTHGVWCVGSCWALMLLPMLLTQGHVVAMVAVTVLMVGERLEPPSAPCWRWRGPGKLKRLALVQARMRLPRATNALTN